MRFPLYWKLMAINGLVILCMAGITWWAVDILAADYFMALMRKYKIDPQASNQMFLETVHRYLLWSTVGAVLLAALLSLWLIRRVLSPLERLVGLIRAVAAGEYGAQVPVGGDDELTTLTRAFNHLSASLARLEGLRRKMVADVAHELRTPLTNMRGYLEGLLDGVVPPRAETYQLLHQETLRLSGLVDDLLALARADAARASLHPALVDYARLWRQGLRTWGPRLAAADIRLVAPEPAPGLTVWADPDRLPQVLDNLLQNALRYTPVGGELTVAIHRRDDLVETVLTNPAPKLTAVDAPLIFERFYRGEQSRSREFGGAGIGLAIVRQLIQAHGGQVWAHWDQGLLAVGFSLPTAPPPETTGTTA